MRLDETGRGSRYTAVRRLQEKSCPKRARTSNFISLEANPKTIIWQFKSPLMSERKTHESSGGFLPIHK